MHTVGSAKQNELCSERKDGSLVCCLMPEDEDHRQTLIMSEGDCFRRCGNVFGFVFLEKSSDCT